MLGPLLQVASILGLRLVPGVYAADGLGPWAYALFAMFGAGFLMVMAGLFLARPARRVGDGEEGGDDPGSESGENREKVLSDR